MLWDFARPDDALRRHEQTLERERIAREREREQHDRLRAIQAARMPDDISHTKDA